MCFSRNLLLLLLKPRAVGVDEFSISTSERVQRWFSARREG
jgi:hypothetical protein